jgi:hypothetical protein
MMLPLSMYAPADGVTDSGQWSISAVSDELKFIFSWVALMPISIVVSGKLIAQIPAFKIYYFQGNDEFGLRVPGLMRLVAQKGEVIFGFTIFITEFFSFAMIAGRWVYHTVKIGFGIDLGQFNSLCAFSALSSVVLTWSIFLIVAVGGAMRRNDPRLKDYEDAINRARGKHEKDEDPPAEQDEDPPAEDGGEQ